MSTEETSKYFSDKVIRSSRFGKVRDMTAKVLTPGPPTPLSYKRTYKFMPEMNDFEETIWLPRIFFFIWKKICILNKQKIAFREIWIMDLGYSRNFSLQLKSPHFKRNVNIDILNIII